MKKFFALILCALTLGTPTAHATEKGWRYWGYYQSSATSHKWVMANTGPTLPLVDGAVEGWVFTLSSKNVQSTPPRVQPRFNTICKGVAQTKDLMRVAVVIDYGNPLITPKGEKVRATHTECVEIFPGATGLDVLQQNFKVRQSAQGFLCAINSFPAHECSAEINVPRALLK